LSWSKLSRPDPSVGSIQIAHVSEEDVGYYQCIVASEYGTAMSNVIQLVVGVVDDFTDGENVVQYTATEYDHFKLPCNAPRSIPAADYFWSLNSSTKDVLIQLDARLQIDQQGHVYMCNSTATFV